MVVSSRVLGGYVLTRPLLVDGRRQIWLAQDRVRCRPVVLKGVRAPDTHPEAEGLRQEFRRLRAITHPAFPQVHALLRIPLEGLPPALRGQVSGPETGDAVPVHSPRAQAGAAAAAQSAFPLWVMVQEWIEGESLLELRGGLSPQALESCARAVLEAVAFLHLLQMVSLDLKPDHILSSPAGWRLIDLDQLLPDLSFGQTELRGTVPYIAPELLSGRSSGPQADLYSVGALLYEGVTGHPPPLHGETLEALAAWLPTSPVPTLPESFTRQAPALAALITALLARAPQGRPASAARALEALETDTGSGGFRRAVLPPAPLLERELPLAQARAWRESRSSDTRAEGPTPGRYSGLRVCGPAGVGTRRFVQSLEDDWQAEGFPVLRLSRSLVASGPGGALQGLLQSLEGLAGATSEASLPPWSPPGAPASAESLLRREAAALGQATEKLALAWQRPVILVVEPENEPVVRAILSRFLPYAAERLAFLILLDGDGAPTLAGSEALPRLELGPLSLEGIGALCDHGLGPGALAPLERAALHDQSQGLPARIRDALRRHLRLREGSQQDPGPDAGGGDSLPDVLHSDPALRQALPLLAVAALFARPCTWRLLQEVAPASFSPANLALLIARGFLERETSSPGDEPRVGLAQPSLRGGLLSTLSLEERRVLHRRAAAALEQQRLFNPQISPVDIASHWLEAAETSAALPWVRRALRQREEADPPQDGGSVTPFTLIPVVRLLATQLTPVDAAVWWWTLSELELEIGDTISAAISARKVLAMSAGQGEPGPSDRPADTSPPLPPHARVRAFGILGRCLVHRGQLAEAEACLEVALEANVPLPAEQRCVWLQTLAWIAMERQNFSSARRLLEQSETELPSPGSVVAVEQLHLEALLGRKTGASLQSCEVLLHQALALARSLSFVRGELNALTSLAVLYEQAARLEPARETLLKAIALAQAAYELPREATLAHNLGVLLREAGDPEEALRWLERAARLYERLGNGRREVENLLACVDLLLQHGRTERAAARLREVTCRIPPGADASWEVARQAVVLCEIRLRSAGQADPEDPVRLEALIDCFEQLEQPLLQLEAVATRMQHLQIEGQAQAVLRLYARVSDMSRTGPGESIWRRIHRSAGDAHRVLEAGRWGARVVPEPVPSEPDREKHGERAAIAPAGVPGERTPPPEPAQTWHWLERIEKLLDVADDDAAAASELARLAGELLGGRGLVFLFDGDRPQVVCGYRIPPDQVDDISSTVIERVRTSRRPYSCADVLMSDELRALRSLRAASVRSIACHPVLLEQTCLGVIYVDHRLSGLAGQGETFELLARISGLAAHHLARLKARQRQTRLEPDRFGLVGESPVMQRLREQLSDIADSTSSDLVVLIQGETGTGKSLIARTLHEHGRRRSGPLVQVDCASIPGELFASLMFGHERGAFTGADQARPGWFEMAREGTLFLDELGEMPLVHQSGMLVTLSSREFRRLGSQKAQHLEGNLICATNRNLEQEAQEGRFRADLLRRIQINVVHVPPLRERGTGDIRLLARLMLTRTLVVQGVRGETAPPADLEAYFTRQALARLDSHTWPWNVGEMENIFRHEGIRRRLREGSVLVDEALLEPLLSRGDRPERWRSESEARAVRRAGGGPGEEHSGSSGQARATVEARGRAWTLPEGLTYRGLNDWFGPIRAHYVRQVYEACGRNVVYTARRLECSRDIVQKYLKE